MGGTLFGLFDHDACLSHPPLSVACHPSLYPAQHHSFYDLIVNKARGKSGPLFDFGVHEDIRVINDASREKNESHAGKVRGCAVCRV